MRPWGVKKTRIRSLASWAAAAGLIGGLLVTCSRSNNSAPQLAEPRASRVAPTTTSGPVRSTADLPKPVNARVTRLFTVSAGKGEGQLGFALGVDGEHAPSELALDANLRILYVLDDDNDRIVAFYADQGTFARQFPLPGETFGGLAVEEGSGDLLVAVQGQGPTLSFLYRLNRFGFPLAAFTTGGVDALYTLPKALPRGGVYLSGEYLNGSPILDNRLGTNVWPGLPVGPEHTAFPRLSGDHIEVERVRTGGHVERIISIYPAGGIPSGLKLLYDADGPVLLVTTTSADYTRSQSALYRLDAELRVRTIVNLPPGGGCGYETLVALDTTGPRAFACQWKPPDGDTLEFVRLDWPSG
jgi:hypothetical protein